MSKMNTKDFLEKTLGMSGFGESSTYGRSRRSSRFSGYSEDARKPVNPFILANGLAFIKADPYKQSAQADRIQAMSEAHRMGVRLTGFGEVSFEDIKEKVVEGAKDAWKAFLALIDKLIEVVKQFIRGFFDKEKKLGDISAKLKKVNIERNFDSSNGKLSGEKTIEVGITHTSVLKNMIGDKDDLTRTVNVTEKSLMAALQQVTDTYATQSTASNDFKRSVADANKLMDEIEKGERPTAELPGSLFAVIGDHLTAIDNGEDGALIEFLTKTFTLAGTLRDKLSGSRSINLNGLTNLRRSSQNDRIDPATATKDTFEDIRIEDYKESWNYIIEVFNDVVKENKKLIKTTVKGKAEDIEAGEAEGVVKVLFPRTADGRTALKAVLDAYSSVITSLKQAKANKKLEMIIKRLGTLKRDIIKNKDNKYSTKVAQLGRVAINKFTIIITKAISLNNTVYSALFKSIGITLKSINRIAEKNSSTSINKNRKNELEEDMKIAKDAVGAQQ